MLEKLLYSLRSVRSLTALWSGWGLVTVIGGVFILGAAAQEIGHSTGVTDVEVLVRVFDGGRFVDDLTIGDFEVLENGKPQKIISLHLVRKTKVLREESPPAPATGPAAPAKAAPATFRNFVLIFEVHDPMPKIEQALDYFLVLLPFPGSLGG